MAITVSCKQCGTLVEAPDSAAGRKGRCTVCGEIMDIPSPAAPALEPMPGVQVVDEKLGLQEAGVRERESSAVAPPPRDSLDELLQRPSNRPVKTRSSCFVIGLIFATIFAVMLAGGGALFYVAVWPAIARGRTVVREASAMAEIKRLALAEQTYFTRNGEFSRRIGGQKSLLSAGLVTPDEAAAEAPPGAGKPFMGLCFRILTKQGSAAKGNGKSFIDAQGKMTGGCAILAYEASGDSTVRAYLCGPDGVIVEKTFDKDAGQGPEGIQSFEPEGWASPGVRQPQTIPTQQ